MSIVDLRLTLSWASDEGWNPGLDDTEPFLAADPPGFLMSRLDEEPAVSIAAAYGDAFGFIGLFICWPDLRGHAVGASLVRAALERLSDRPAGINGVLARVANYERLGFVQAHQNTRYRGSIEPTTLPDPRVRIIDAGLAPIVAAFDAKMFGCERSDFIPAWLTPTPTRSGIALVEDGEVTGFEVVRDCAYGHKIGPLFASSVGEADSILGSLAATRPGGTFFLDVPAPNRDGLMLAEGQGMSAVFETARMYRGGEWNLPLERTFGVTTFELG